MDLVAALLAFTAAAALLTVTPGPDSALVLRTAAVEGPAHALLAGIGICLGCLAWGVIVALGLGVMLAASTFAYTVLKWAGAAYLVYLGVKLILSPRRRFEAADDAPLDAAGGGGVWFRRGLLTNLLNPKVGVFYVSFLPQFIPAEANVPVLTVVMAGIHIALTVVWFLFLIAATRPLAGMLQARGVVTWLDRLTAGLFIAFGARLALEVRR